ncbi:MULTISPECIES: hypothetical protein [unclassified Microbacterium]|uniref:hypothetical protein n=1 Tax=unclassified Microbacterium TaxID=2609290 RepID=UPI001604D7E3|nr:MULTISPECIES: hypothetical protein [unclassified Microbacterium]QNA92613.1 hypothetical protein G4G29_09910 [Microbacterium sp. Se63.02b]QYM65913.1 hypothetical protein K1X59_09945 [Microbacterium sp. Se5.02b]
MRKTSAVLASLSLAVVALTGCAAAAPDSSATCDRGVGSTEIRDAVTIDGEVGTTPDVSVFSPLHLKRSAFADATVGDGRTIVDDNQAIVAEISIFSGETGKQVFATSYDESKGQVSTAGYWATQSPGLATVFDCATAGSRIVAGLTPDDFGANNLEGFGLSADDNVVFVIDVVDVFLSRAEGAPQFNDAKGMPTVVRAPDGTPGVIIPDSAAPEEQVVQTLIKGEGEEVATGQVPLLNVMAVGWDDKKVVTSTWGQGPTGDLSSAPSVAEAIIGKTVGSQILVVTPAGDSGPAVAYVVDILGAVTAPTQ